MRRLAGIRIVALAAISLFAGCATPAWQEQSQEDINHAIWSMSLAAPAMGVALGPLDRQTLDHMSEGMPEGDKEALIEMSTAAFHPDIVYAKMRSRSMQAGTKEQMAELAEQLSSQPWAAFAQNLLWYFGEEGSEQVEETMRLLDRDEFELDMEKARIAESISLNSYNIKMVDLLYAQMAPVSPTERFLYRKSLFVATYLAGQDLTLEQLETIDEIRSGRVYQNYKRIFESVIFEQYQQFFRALQAYGNEREA